MGDLQSRGGADIPQPTLMGSGAQGAAMTGKQIENRPSKENSARRRG
jgi:hypothetical protein